MEIVKKLNWLMLLMMTCLVIVVSAMEPVEIPANRIFKIYGLGGGEGEPLEIPWSICELSAVLKLMIKEDMQGDNTHFIPMIAIQHEVLQEIFRLLKIYKKDGINGVEKVINALDVQSSQNVQALVNLINSAMYLDVFDILPILGNKVINIINNIDIDNFVLEGSGFENISEDFVKKYVSPQLMRPSINQLKVKILQDAASARQMSCTTSDIPNRSVVAAFMNNNTWIVIGGIRQHDNSDGVVIWDTFNNSFTNFCSGNRGDAVIALAVYEDAEKKYIALSDRAVGNELLIWNVSNIAEKKQCTCIGLEDNVKRLAFSKDGTFLLAAHEDDENTISIWNTKTIKWDEEKPKLDLKNTQRLSLGKKLDEEKILGLFIAADNQTCFVVGRQGQNIKLFDIKIGSDNSMVIETVQTIISDAWYVDRGVKVAFSVDGNKIAIMYQYNDQNHMVTKIVIFNHTDSHVINWSTATANIVMDGIAFTADGEWLVFVCEHYFLHVFDSFNRNLITKLHCLIFQSAVCFSSDGKKMLVLGEGDEGKINLLWNMFNDQELRVFKELSSVNLKQVLLLGRIVKNEESQWNFNDDKTWFGLNDNIRAILLRYCFKSVPLSLPVVEGKLQEGMPSMLTGKALEVEPYAKQEIQQSVPQQPSSSWKKAMALSVGLAAGTGLYYWHKKITQSRKQK